MAEHIFLQEGGVQVADINEILDLTATGDLEWGRDPRFAVLGSNVWRTLGRDVATERNLLEVRVSYIPGASNTLNYLRLIDAQEQRYYVEDGSEQGLIELATRLLRVGEIAVHSSEGKMSGEIEECGECGCATGHIKLYEAAHGIPGAVMAGSERSECVRCGSSRSLALEV